MMSQVLKYSPFVLAIALFFVGRYSAPVQDRDLIRKFELERKTLKEDIQAKEAQINDLTNAGLTIAKRMKEDSLKTYVQLQANKRAFLELKRKYNEINLSSADSHVLDSLVSSLYANRN
jgi:hypothetical protein